MLPVSKNLEGPTFDHFFFIDPITFTKNSLKLPNIHKLFLKRVLFVGRWQFIRVKELWCYKSFSASFCLPYSTMILIKQYFLWLNILPVLILSFDKIFLLFYLFFPKVSCSLSPIDCSLCVCVFFFKMKHPPVIYELSWWFVKDYYQGNTAYDFFGLYSVILSFYSADFSHQEFRISRVAWIGNPPTFGIISLVDR